MKRTPLLPGLVPAHRAPPPRASQGGVTTIVVLAFVLALGVLGIGGFFLAQGQWRLVGNLQSQDRAFSQAEATLALAEKWLSNPANASASAFSSYDSTSKGLYPAGQLATLGWDPKSMTWNDTNSIAAGPGRYIIERIGSDVRPPGTSLQIGQGTAGRCQQVNIYRIVAWSSSVRGTERFIEAVNAYESCP